MLSERVKEWTKDGYEEGFKAGFEKGIEQGLETGTKQGIKKGFMQGEVLIVTRLLEKRFGCLPEWAKKKLNSANDEQLDIWSGRILQASNLEMALDDNQDLTEIYNMLADGAHELMARWRDHGYKTGIEKGIEQGEAKGIELGCAEGVRQGEAHMLARLLEKHFGPLPDQAKKKLDTASRAQLKIWSDKLINANSLNNFFE